MEFKKSKGICVMSNDEQDRIKNLRKKLNVDETHLLIPTMFIERVNPFYDFCTIYIQPNLNPNSGEVYKVGSVYENGKDVPTYSLCKPLLERLAAAAGIQMNSINSYYRMPDEYTFVGHVEAAILMPDGVPRLLSNEKVINMKREEDRNRLSALKRAAEGLYGDAARSAQKLYHGEWKENDEGKKRFYIDKNDLQKYIENSVAAAMVQLWKHSPQIALTGAWLRVIRSALGMKGQYTETELKQPFVITRLNFSPDFNDPEIRHMALRQGFRSLGNVFGVASFGRAGVPDKTVPYQIPDSGEDDEYELIAGLPDGPDDILGSEPPEQHDGSDMKAPKSDIRNVTPLQAPPKVTPQEKNVAEKSSGDKAGQGNTCVACGKQNLSPKVVKYSLENFNEVLCYNCGQKRKKESA
jgi:hypothetical protein